jgi:hypothetical protein
MTADLMGPPPSAGAVDPLAPEHVAPLVVYLASPAGEAINGEVFVVHGGVAAVMEPPRIRTTFQASESGSEDGMWTLESVGQALAGLSSGAGFMSEATRELATETIGFPDRAAGTAPWGCLVQRRARLRSAGRAETAAMADGSGRSVLSGGERSALCGAGDQEPGLGSLLRQAFHVRQYGSSPDSRPVRGHLRR